MGTSLEAVERATIGVPCASSRVRRLVCSPKRALVRTAMFASESLDARHGFERRQRSSRRRRLPAACSRTESKRGSTRSGRLIGLRRRSSKSHARANPRPGRRLDGIPRLSKTTLRPTARHTEASRSLKDVRRHRHDVSKNLRLLSRTPLSTFDEPGSAEPSCAAQLSVEVIFDALCAHRRTVEISRSSRLRT